MRSLSNRRWKTVVFSGCKLEGVRTERKDGERTEVAVVLYTGQRAGLRSVVRPVQQFGLLAAVRLRPRTRTGEEGRGKEGGENGDVSMSRRVNIQEANGLSDPCARKWRKTWPWP